LEPHSLQRTGSDSHGNLDIAEDELREIGMYAYQYQFLPLLEYARQFPPFVAEVRK
jgi:hypothetical protein